jgi:hypothetical protein
LISSTFSDAQLNSGWYGGMAMIESENEIFRTMTNGIRKNSISHRNGTDVTSALPVMPQRRNREPTGERTIAPRPSSIQKLIRCPSDTAPEPVI